MDSDRIETEQWLIGLGWRRGVQSGEGTVLISAQAPVCVATLAPFFPLQASMTVGGREAIITTPGPGCLEREHPC